MDAPLPISKVPEPLEDEPVKIRPPPTSDSSEVPWAPQIASVPNIPRPDLSSGSVHCRETPKCSLPARRAKRECSREVLADLRQGGSTGGLRFRRHCAHREDDPSRPSYRGPAELTLSVHHFSDAGCFCKQGHREESVI